MVMPYDDYLVNEKHKTQCQILKEAGGDLKKYSRIVEREAQQIRAKYKGKFKKVKPLKRSSPA